MKTLGEETLPVRTAIKEVWEQYLDPVDATPPKRQIIVAAPEESVHHLDQLIPLALDVQYKILKHTPLEPESEDYIVNAKLVLATAQSVMSAQIKVDENQFKRQKQEDILTILQELKDEERKQGLLELALNREH